MNKLYLDELIELYNENIKIDNLSQYDDKAALDIIGGLIDTSYFLEREEGLTHALKLSEEIIKRNLNEENRSELHYYLSNLWTDLKRFNTIDIEDQWVWEQKEFENIIINIRCAFKFGFLSNKYNTSNNRKCEILTNYGNTLSEIGRFIEGIECRDKALEIDPNFLMAKGTKGIDLFEYSYLLYDTGHRSIFLNHAYKYLKCSLEKETYPQAESSFQNYINRLETDYPKGLLTAKFDLTSFELGKSQEEIGYRKWALKNRLFLNPLNDLGIYSIAANDVLMTPSITTKLKEGPHYQGFFNQLKQEFVSARYLFYEGFIQENVHFSDIDVKLFDTGDFPKYGVNIEKIKIAYRMAYSIFDKIAVFINYYFKLGQGGNQNIYFNNIWKTRKNGKMLIEKGGEFYNKNNLPLRGLFWLSKDLHYDDKEFKDSIEPESRELKNIRHSLEHKYVKVHSDSFLIDNETVYSIYGKDRSAYSINITDLTNKTLKILKLARSALMYLSLAMFVEENQRNSNKKIEREVLPIHLEIIKNENKRIDF